MSKLYKIVLSKKNQPSPQSRTGPKQDISIPTMNTQPEKRNVFASNPKNEQKFNKLSLSFSQAQLFSPVSSHGKNSPANSNPGSFSLKSKNQHNKYERKPKGSFTFVSKMNYIKRKKRNSGFTVIKKNQKVEQHSQDDEILPKRRNSIKQIFKNFSNCHNSPCSQSPGSMRRENIRKMTGSLFIKRDSIDSKKPVKSRKLPLIPLKAYCDIQDRKRAFEPKKMKESDKEISKRFEGKRYRGRSLKRRNAHVARKEKVFRVVQKSLSRSRFKMTRVSDIERISWKVCKDSCKRVKR